MWLLSFFFFYPQGQMKYEMWISSSWRNALNIERLSLFTTNNNTLSHAANNPRFLFSFQPSTVCVVWPGLWSSKKGISVVTGIHLAHKWTVFWSLPVGDRSGPEGRGSSSGNKRTAHPIYYSAMGFEMTQAQRAYGEIYPVPLLLK